MYAGRLQAARLPNQVIEMVSSRFESKILISPEDCGMSLMFRAEEAAGLPKDPT